MPCTHHHYPENMCLIVIFLLLHQSHLFIFESMLTLTDCLVLCFEETLTELSHQLVVMDVVGGFLKCILMQA